MPDCADAAGTTGPAPPPTVAQAVPVPAPAGPRCKEISPPTFARVRAARQESEGAPPPGDALNRSLAANLPAPAQGVAADNARQSGGVFTIKLMDYDDAAFAFYGWNNEMRRQTPQMIEVRKGNNSDMRIAVVRRMIAIIRDFEKEDFVWESPQRGRTVVLSARPADNAALEAF